MVVELTPQQQQQVDASPDNVIEVVGAGTEARYILLTQQQYDNFLDARDRRGLAMAGLASLTRRLREDE
jgi:hypothetical protein